MYAFEKKKRKKQTLSSPNKLGYKMATKVLQFSYKNNELMYRNMKKITT